MPSFPTSLVTTAQITNANPATSLSANNHASKHDATRDEIIAVETKVGIDGSVVTTTHDYKLNEVTGVDKAVGKSAVQTLLNKIFGTGTKIILGSDAVGDTWYATASNVLARLGIGSIGQVLTVAGGIPSWQSPSSTNVSYIADTGVANAYVATLVPAIASYTAGQLVQFKATNANTTASTVNVNGLGVKTIKKLGGATDLASGDIAAGMIVELEYDGTNFLMLNPVANAPLTASTQSVLGLFGDGSDGVATISSDTTLTRDMNYSNLTVNNTFNLITAGFRVYVSGTLTNNGTIHNNGVGNSGGAAGTLSGVAGGTGGAPVNSGGTGGGGGGICFVSAKAVAVQGTISANGASGAAAATGANLSAGATGGTTSNSLIQSGTGGVGGVSGGGHAGGIGGVITTSSKMSPKSIILLTMMIDGVTRLSGGAGGGSGGQNGSTGAGGGGGGQGGVAIFIYQTITTSGTLTATGGVGGALFGAGAIGVAGSSGLTILLVV